MKLYEELQERCDKYGVNLNDEFIAKSICWKIFCEVLEKRCEKCHEELTKGIVKIKKAKKKKAAPYFIDGADTSPKVDK